MKILYFHQYFSTPEGSAGLRSYYMAKALVERGHEVIMITGRHDRSALPVSANGNIQTCMYEGIKLVCLPVSTSNKHPYSTRIISFIIYAVIAFFTALKYPADIAIATSTPLTAAIPAVGVHFLMRIPFVFEARDLWPDAAIEMGVLQSKPAILLSRWLEKRIYSIAEYCIALAPGTAQAMSRRGAAHVTVIPNGINFTRGTLRIKSASINQKNTGRFTLVYAGAFGRANAVSSILEVAKRIKKRGMKDIQFNLIGDGACFGKLKSIIEQENLTNVFLKKPVKSRNLYVNLKEAQVGLLLMQDIDNFRCCSSPNKFSLYLTAGLPVICNYGGWIARLITLNECGIVVSHTNIDEYIDAVVTLKNDWQLCERMSENGSRLCREQFDMKILTQKFTQIVENYG